MKPAQLRQSIAKSGLSLKDFGKTIGVSGRTVEGWLSGRPMQPTAQILIGLLYSKAASITASIVKHQ